MNWQLIRVESQKFLRWYALSLGITVAIVILWEAPLIRDNTRLGILAAVQGFLVAWSLFSDPGGSASFVWSRPMTRRALFLHRWLFGLACLAAMWLALLVVIGGGLRAGLQGWIGNIYPAAIRKCELDVLFPAILFSMLAYQLTLFMKVRHDLFAGAAHSRGDAVLRTGGLLLVGAGIPVGLAIMAGLFGEFTPWTPLQASAYVAITAVLTTAGAVCAYVRMEVEA